MSSFEVLAHMLTSPGIDADKGVLVLKDCDNKIISIGHLYRLPSPIYI